MTGEAFRLGRHGARRLANLRLRATVLGAIRRFFDARGFLEVETPLLVPAPGVELHLECFEVPGAGWLSTSPELQMKRLLVAMGQLRRDGDPPVRIYQLTRAFRRDEVGRHHDREFTILEWYRLEEPYERIMDDVVELIRACADAVDGRRQRSYQGEPIDLDRVERLSVAEAMRRHAGVDLAALGDSDDWDERFFRPFVEAVEPRLGRGQITLLDRWPVRLGALARRAPDDPTVVERFEAFAAGLELCNAFGELCDPKEQRARFEADLAQRRLLGRPTYPIDERFLAALEEGLPPASGIALGVDRLVMLLADAPALEDVVAFTSREL